MDALGLLIKLETTLIQECLNVFELSVVVILVLDLLLEGLAELLGSIVKLISGEAARGSGSCHESWLLFCHQEGLAWDLATDGATHGEDSL